MGDIKDKIDKIIDSVLEHTIVDGLCSSCSDNDSAHAIVSTDKYNYIRGGKTSDWDECKKAIMKIIKEDG